MSWVLQRLEHCNDSHPACKATFHSPLPKRVLDLGDSNNPYVRLYESQGEVERYICLSHCWGAHLLIRTLSTNLLSYQDEIPWDALSLTYQETIVFVRKLRIRYLWIDSLCIIQDNEVDWRDEAANMASIYQNSYLTICAAMSANTGGGLFSNAGPEFKPHRLTYPDGDGRSQEVYARIQLSHAHFPGIYGSTPKLPIYNRGWILQERLLSPRVLHFAPQELNWECLAETVCECSCTISNVVEGPNTHHSIVDMAELSMSPKRFYSFARLSLMDKEWVERRWRKLVEEYTTLELTYERDIFPAISGLAKEFNRARKSAYFGGLWQSSLLADMLWYASHNSYNLDPSPTRPKEWRAPTWSWASTKSKIAYIQSSNFHSSCKVLGVECSSVGQDPMGQLTGGHMLLCGQLYSTSLQYTPQPQSASPYLHGDNNDLGFRKAGRGNVPCYPDYDYWVEGPGYIKSGTMVYLFRVGRDIRDTEPNGSTTVFFLVLRLVGDDALLACRVYERIGLVIDYFARSSHMEETVVEEIVVKII
jgi:hypothetical protein